MPVSRTTSPQTTPAIVGASLAVLDLLESSTELKDKLADNTAFFRTAITAAGFEPSSGVETILTAAMKDSGRPVYGLETIQQQLQFFATLTPKAELQMLDDAMDDVDDGVGKLQAVVSAWQAGDVEAIGKLLDEDLVTKEPDAYKALIIDRNVAWSDRLAERLTGSGVSFVAVGAGHLAGTDSVQVLLARRGLTVERQ